MSPKPGALGTDTYSIRLTKNGLVSTLAANHLVSSIPAGPGLRDYGFSVP